MQAIRINTRLPVYHRVAKQITPTRNMSLFGSFGPRSSPFAGEFAPLFRLLDDYANHSVSRGFGPSFNQTVRSFQPRFDVKEGQDAYELHGELPGIDQKDINIEFTDAQTLTIKGRTERHTESGTPPTAAVEGQPEPAKITEAGEKASSDSASETYHKATAEDEDQTMSGANPAAESTTNATEQAQSDTQVTKTEQSQTPAQQQRPQSRYWVSERSVGEFHRTFTFPSRVDQDAVTASLKNGILSIVVPKATAPATRRVNIE
ncbi:hypothetical protein H2203_003920 [Taxawa tesnikishii (nom. ined.)]|nr:hypothetical protein H2203_003920 [Dothideales sp. JES 119]